MAFKRLGLFAAGLAVFLIACPTASARQDETQATVERAQTLIEAESFDEAATMLREITLAEPENGRAWFLLGYALHADGRLDEALPAHLMAAEFEGAAPTAMYNVACVYALKGRKSKAFAWLDRAMEACFRNRNVLRTDPDLDSLREDPRFAKYVRTAAPPRPQRMMPLITEPEPPRESDPGAELGFWIGQWDVTWDGGQGRSTVDRILDERVIREHLQGQHADGPAAGTMSLAMHDADEGTWRQTWVSSDGRYLTLVGGLDGGRIVLRSVDGDGKTGGQRVVFSNIAPDGFHWRWERRDEATGGWEVLRSMRYTRRD